MTTPKPTDIDALRAENERLRKVIETHDLCHNNFKVGAREFADGCAKEQRKHFGCAPDADALAALRAKPEASGAAALREAAQAVAASPHYRYGQEAGPDYFKVTVDVAVWHRFEDVLRSAGGTP